ncbi:ribulose-phosphate 3-epimerase [Lewinella marina]|uniref:Ribulose-phosphate 3-epimerase n=1 Tax=Neolewinella marina TaxID=438751 RepID=A0A2G0CGA1_9BACT|nr:ribulose-phosphate 3-epimerase [Neolewinella marina]NJB86545.1 ribulose-phosphate 3-epimerase [Neolewinella marina]PHK99001.1 ribulose-phosphate 3-epimerase [Neolewinella marina]
MSHLVAPSLLAADFRRLDRAIELVNTSEADWFHLDVMDGRFVPNISFGQFIVEQIAAEASKYVDVHLMIEDPVRYVESFARAGATGITVHAEACTHLHRVIQVIRESGAKAGVALNPHTPVNVLDHVIEDLDLVLIMTVNPGFGGQKFIYHSLEKVRQTAELIAVRNSRAIIEVDGGIGLQNAQKVLEAGARVLVAGSAVFGADDPAAVIRDLKAIAPNPIAYV